MNLLTTCLLDGLLACVVAVGFSVNFRPSRKILLAAAILAPIGHVSRLLLMQVPFGIVSATMFASMAIALCSMPISRFWHIPAEMFIFPSLLPMVPGMHAYKTILGILQILNEKTDPHFLSLVVYNGLTTLFVMGALVIGASLPLIVFREDGPLGRLLIRLLGQRAIKLLHHRGRP
ncbi:MAG: threonine/serine exporter family protein [Desulfovibrio sp.]|nr:threonine/serine exporter family protein [Desulfovibrio sp.]